MEINGDVVYGKNAIIEALKGGRRVKQVFLSTSASKSTFNDVINMLNSRHIRYSTRNDFSLKRMCGADSHQGIIAVVETAQYHSIDDLLRVARSRGEPPFLLVLDGIEDPQNLGAIIRSAECAGVHGVVIPQHGSAKITPAVVRVAAGATEHMKVAVVEKVPKTLSELSEHGIKIIGTDASAKTKYYNIPMREAVAIVVGSEGSGLKKSTIDACDILVSIPLMGRINSLNASVSAAILMFEAVRQRTK